MNEKMQKWDFYLFLDSRQNFSNINSIYLSAAWIKYFISTIARVSRFIDNPAQGAGHPGEQLVAQLDDLFHCYLDFCSDLPDLREIQCSNLLPGVHPRHVVQAGLSVSKTHNSYLKKNTKKTVLDGA